MAAGCPPMAWGVAMLHADEVPHRRRRCQVLALSQSPFSCLSPWPPLAPGTPLGPALYNPGGALQPGIQQPAPRHFSCTCGHIVGYTLIHKPINNRHNYNQRNYEKWVSTTAIQRRAQRARSENTRLITVHSHTDLQQESVTPASGRSAALSLPPEDSQLRRDKQTQRGGFVTLGGGFFSSTSSAWSTRLEKRGPIGT